MNSKIKIGLHSFGVLFIFTILFLVLISLKVFRGFPYLIAGAPIIAEIFRIIFSKTKYLISICQNDSTISITYLNRLLIKKSILIDKQNLNISDVNETNWWLGRLDFINFDNGRQNVTFDYVDKNLKKTVTKIIDVV